MIQRDIELHSYGGGLEDPSQPFFGALPKTNGVEHHLNHVGDFKPDQGHTTTNAGDGTEFSGSHPDSNGKVIKPIFTIPSNTPEPGGLDPKPKRTRKPWVYKEEYDRMIWFVMGLAIGAALTEIAFQLLEN